MVERKIVKKLYRLKAFCDLPLKASWNNYEVLKTALQCEQKDVVLFLLREDCPVNSESDVRDNTPLHYAVKLEDTELIQLLISKGASLTCQNQKGDTPLHAAAMSRNTEIVDLLLQNIESAQYVNPANKFGLTHMHIACMRDKPDIVEKFLKSGVGKDISVNLDSPFWPGYTPLHFAVEFCSLDVVQLLMKRGADQKCKDAQGTDPYYLSYCKYQNASMINFFMHTHYWPWEKKINFHVACLEGDKGIVEKYLKHGAIKKTCEMYIFDQCIYECDQPLQCAVRSESVATVELLLKNNADIYSTNDWNMTPLHVAFYMEAREDFDVGVLKVLYSAYNFKNMKNLTDSNDLSFFHIICSQGDNELIEYLLQKGVDVNSQIDYVFNGFNQTYFQGYTALHLAIHYHHTETVKLLLHYGADITKGEESPLEYAISLIDEDIIKVILDSRTDPSTVKIRTGENPFHLLLMNDEAYYHHKDMINILYEKGCNVNSQSNNGDTPLHKAYSSATANIQALLDLGADINIENINGETPLMTIRNKDLSLQYRIFFVSFPAIYRIFISHVEKLKAIGFYVSEKNISFIEELFEQQAEIDPDRSYLNSEYFSVLQHQYKNEIEKMKRIKVTNYSSLYDILFANANRMAFHCNNRTFLDIMELNDFDNQFASYGYLLKLQLKRGNERKAILEPAKKALKLILKRVLPDCCSEEVLSYLSHNDLKTLIKTVITDQIAKNPNSDIAGLQAK